MEKLNIQYIEEFIVLAEHLNFSTAADRLYISQPTLSRHISTLESQLGFKLVERRPFTRLTPMGKSFYIEAGELLEKTLASLDGIARRIADKSGDMKALRVPDLGEMIRNYGGLMDRAARLVGEEHAPMVLDVVYSDYDAFATLGLEEYCSGSALDYLFAFAAHGERPLDLESPGLCQKMIVTQELKLVMERDNPLNGKDEIHLCDVSGGSFKCYASDGFMLDSYRNAVKRLFDSAGAELSYRKPFAFRDSSGVWGSVNLSDSFTFMMDGATALLSNAGSRLVVRAIEDFPMLIDCYLVYRDDSGRPEVAWFADALVRSAEESGQADGCLAGR